MIDPRKLFLTLAILSALFAAGCDSAPLGFGEGIDSPDGRLTASVMRFDQMDTYGHTTCVIKITLTRKSDGEVVWNDEISCEDDSRAPDYYDRSKQFIEWSQDSLSFQLEVLGGQVRTVTVPGDA